MPYHNAWVFGLGCAALLLFALGWWIWQGVAG